MMYTLLIQKRFPDFDAQGIVNHGTQCAYIELGYVSFICECIDPQLSFTNFPITLLNQHTKHLRPITANADVLVRLSVAEIRADRFKLDVELVDARDESFIYTIGTRLLVATNIRRQTSQRLSTSFKENLEKYLLPKLYDETFTDKKHF